jgi:predicted acetylornithine/succinylornithine family transaminase
MTTADLYARHVMPTYARLPLTLVRGEGCRVWDDHGRGYLDFCSGIAVCSLGHCHPRVIDAIRDQAATLIHVSNLYHMPQQAQLAAEINDHHVRLPGKVFFSNSGAEANDGLIKSARRFGHRRPQPDGTPRVETLTFDHSFHGRTLGSMAATAQAKIHEGFDPLLPGFRYLPFNDIAALEAGIRPETVAILLEPVQGEGGVHAATPEFLRAAAALCRKHDLLLLFDEVQAGFGRCGEAMAWRAIAPEIEPDGISWAKGMGAGVPIGAFWLSDRAIDVDGTPLSSIMGAGSHGSTYGGNPLVCAASLAALREIRESALANHALHIGNHIRDTITSWQHPLVREVRGIGLLIGVALDADRISVPEGKTAAATVVGTLLDAGLLAPAAGPETVRLLPPLNITQAEADEALAILRRLLDALS